MIKKAMVTLSCLGALTGMSQQQQQQLGNLFSNVRLSNQSYVQRQNNTALYASNNISNQAKSVQTNKVTRRAPVQHNVARNVNPEIQPLVQNEDVQQVQVQTNVIDNNIGNEINLIQQIASAEMPAIQIGTGHMSLSMDLSMPKLNLNLNRRSSVAQATSNSAKHKLLQLEKKVKKMNRKFAAKLSGRKKLKIKVDNCFKW